MSRASLALDDTVALDEDSPLALAPLANDLIQTGETPVLEIATPPAHGALLQNPDGAATIMAGKPLALDLLAGAAIQVNEDRCYASPTQGFPFGHADISAARTDVRP